MFEYQKTGRFFALVAGKMEEYGAAEIKEFGAKEINPVYRGVWFKTDLEHVYRINLWSRLITRILAPLLTFKCHSTDYLYQTARKIEWEKIISENNTFAIFATVSNSKITHSRFAALRLKDAIADRFMELKNIRPNVDTKNPDVWFNLHIDRDKAKISLDVSGGSLHKRGYRVESVAAPMQETLAAAIIRISGWNGKVPLLDPMCGGGTILSEALLYYCRIPSAFQKKQFGFHFLPDFENDIWQNILSQLQKVKRELQQDLLSGCDINNNAVNAARKNLNLLPEGNLVRIQNRDFREHPGLKNGVIITNPPYGIRLGDERKLEKLYKEFGDFLKQKCHGSTAWIFCGNRNLIKSIGLKPSRKIPLINGNLDGRLLRIEIY